MTNKERVSTVLRVLNRTYPEAHCALTHVDPFQLLMATILSAQCTDECVNRVTPALFQRFPTAERMAEADPAVLEKAIHPTGFFRAKTRSLLGASRRLAEDFGGRVPQTMEELLRLPGVARKTANVVLGTAYGIASGVVVDTHVIRISQRLGLSRHQNPVKIEQDLMRLIPGKQWIAFSHQVIFHGRRICEARKPKCAQCPLMDVCVFPDRLRIAADSKKGPERRG